MSLLARVRFLFGILFVFLVVGLLVLYLNDRISTVQAVQADLSADTTNVGVDYPGLVIAKNITEGDRVTKGETLFVVNSPQLTTDIANHSATVTSLPFSLDDAGNILVKTNTSGIVEQVNYLNGSYVTGGSVMATIYASSGLYVSGHFQLSSPDYTRLKNGSIVDVTFPDNSKAKAVVYNIALMQDGNTVDTVIEARFSSTDTERIRFPIGTPVGASLRLTNTTWWDDATHAFNKLFSSKAG